MAKFDKDVTDKLILAIRKGATYEIACNYARISFRSFRNWILRGKKGEEGYVQFLHDIKEAEGHTALVWLDKIDEGMKEQWTAAAWKLERRYYKDYSANPQVRQEMKEIQKDIKKLKRESKSNEKENK